MEKPLKAFSVLETCEHTGGIVFAKTNAQARRIGAGLYADGEFDGVECRRAPAFDVFSPGPVSSLEMWRRGWWFECGCGRRLDSDWADDHPRPREPREYRGELYCDQWCVLDSAEQRAGQRLNERMARYLAGEALPDGCEVVRGYKNWDYVPDPVEGEPWSRRTRKVERWEAEFTFPGAQGRGKWRSDGPITVERRDLTAWYDFRGVPEDQRSAA
jgi:hypothetical protein